MSYSVDTAFVANYRAQLEHQFQQRGSKLRGTVSVVTQNAEFDYYDRLGTATSSIVTTRHADTQLDDIDHTRRRNQTQVRRWATLFDTPDRVRMLIDPTAGYAEAAAMELGRKMDDDIITAATGTAYSGKAGATSVAYDTAYRIAQDYVESGAAANSNLTIGKLRQALYLLESNDAIMDGEPVFFVGHPKQKQALLRSTEIQSSDYNTVKALVNGEVDTFMGFKFIWTTRATVSSNVRTCLVYPQSAIKLGIAEDIKVRIGERADKNYSVQVFAESIWGATRMWEEKVISVLCNETV